MELVPKPFQDDAIDKLKKYLEEARLLGDPSLAFQQATEGQNYRSLAGMPEVPSVCLRLPTGGGKTILGAYAVGAAAESYLEREFPVVLWLVPSDAIRSQTRKALADPDHPYRMALGKVFAGRVRVFDITDFRTITPQDVRANCCVIVGTMQTLRVTNTEGRKVYKHDENLMGHFTAAALRTPGLELNGPGEIGAGTAKFSFANLLKVHRPIVIVDEAHNFVTPLADDVRQRIGPGVVIELTATPDVVSNVLYRASASELKDAEMIKLPVVLTEHNTQWQDAVGAALATRRKLAALAEAEPDYVRPLLLVQAQNAGMPSDWKAVKQYLMETERMPEAEIAVHTGDKRELDGVDLFSHDCPVTTIITVQALKEGWDCSFAYVLCSTANIGNAQDVEQLLGRVLRMPYARERKEKELNKAYAHVTSARFGDAARSLADALIDMGFERDEAKLAVETPQGDLPLMELRPTFIHVLPTAPDLTSLSFMERKTVAIAETPAGEFELTVRGPLPTSLSETIVQAAPEGSRQRIQAAVEEHNQAWAPSPSERGVPFNVPRLLIEVDGTLQLFDEDTVDELWDWDLKDHPADLSAFSYDETTRKYSLDIEGNNLVLTPMTNPALQLELMPTEVTPMMLVRWLDPKLRDIKMNQTMLAPWLLAAVNKVLERPGISMEVLDRGKFILLKKLGELIAAARVAEAKKGYQTLLFDPGAQIVTSEEFSFRFPKEYPANSFCPGSYRFQKHYYPRPGEMKDRGEEFDCAVELDRLDEVKHWVRNLGGPGRDKTSFWLQTSTDRFYPDFVAELVDGRMFVVEYKGESYKTNDDSKEKNPLGQLWAERSGGRALFLMAVARDDRGRNVRDQMKAAISNRVQTRGLAAS
jgi:type III restriction enzyme